MKKMLKRLCMGFLAFATIVTALPSTPVHAESKQYWTESAERVGIIEKVMNDGSIGSTFNEGMMKVEGETAYCIDINTDFKNGYKTRADASTRMSADQISDVALSLEYVKQYSEAHKELNYKQVYMFEDDGQTVLITERIIKIHTTATDKDGNKELEAGKDVTIIDTVTLEGLEVGTQYKLVGWQMLKEENAELLINGKRVESDYTFTADSETMKVEVAFTFDATSLDGKQLVTFEELYDLSNPDEPKKVTEHKDIEDEGQTITFEEKPEVPEEPETPQTPEKPNRPSDSPKTGDNTNLYGLLALLMTSGAGLAGIFFYKRRKMKKS